MLAYGLDHPAGVRITREEITLSGIRAEIDLAGKRIKVVSALIGRFNLSNILAAAAAASVLGVEPSAIEAGIKNLTCIPGRLQKVDSSSGIHVFVDYAHKPDALKQVLQNLNKLKQKEY